ncbi:MAG: 2OG-Fe(II) oxygenase family protein, partial [Hyphomicrobiaceae bacterium]
IHPHSVISGTYYVDVPPGSGAIRFEDPRHAMMMAAPPRKVRAKRDNQTFVTIEPKPGLLLLWESWLRHDVPVNNAEAPRLSVSFNYGWGDA